MGTQRKIEISDVKSIRTDFNTSILITMCGFNGNTTSGASPIK